ncbi:MAG: helix-turn-helix domain-containing protein [Sedimentisphaerales bacterium]
MRKNKEKIDLVESLKRRYIKTKRQQIAYEKSYKDAEIASKIYELRQQAGLTQKQLAKLIGTKQPVISRLEEADYRGHSLEMLRRIAAALHCRLEVNIVPDTASHRRHYAHIG